MLLTVIILAKNEAHNIPGCLESLSRHLLSRLGNTEAEGEILVLDDMSQDGTAAIARSWEARVEECPMAGNFSAQRQKGLELARGTWVLFIDADERLTPELGESIAAHLCSGLMAAGSFRRRNFAFGRRERFGPLGPDRVSRLFPRSAVSFSGLVHERALTALPVERLKGSLEHHTYRTWDRYLEKQRLYAELWSSQAANDGQKSSPVAALFKAGASVMKMLFLKLGLLGGPNTWALSLLYGSYTLSKYLLLSQKSQEKPLALEIENRP
jgi:glycosyltransferase involved in cell wall biosynthesis